MAKSWWDIEEVSRNVHKLRVVLNQSASRYALWISDVHWDNPKCDRELFKACLDEAVEKDAPIFIVGDFFCAMQGKYDRRSSKDDVRPEHQSGNYLDVLVDDAIQYLEPYKDHIALISDGNHETAITKNHETNLLDRLTSGLRRAGGVTLYGGYQGWVIHHVTLHKNSRTSWTAYYWHGGGGGAPVTKGQIDFNRIAEFVTADAYICGHIHRRNCNDQAVMSLNADGKQIIKQRDYVRLSTFKQEGDQSHGWAVERKMGPRPLGGYWCELGSRSERKKGKRPLRHFRRWVPTI